MFTVLLLSLVVQVDEVHGEGVVFFIVADVLQPSCAYSLLSVLAIVWQICFSIDTKNERFEVELTYCCLKLRGPSKATKTFALWAPELRPEGP